MTPQDVLLKAADLFETVGWQQRTYGDHVNGYCALGAVSQVVWGDPLGPRDWDMDSQVFNVKVNLQGDALILLPGHIKGGSVTQWNDRSRRTKKSVIETFRKAAA